MLLLYMNINQELVNSLHGLLNGEIGGLHCRVITTEYRTRVHCIHMYHLFCKALVLYSEVSGQCLYTISSSVTPSIYYHCLLVSIVFSVNCMLVAFSTLNHDD